MGNETSQQPIRNEQLKKEVLKQEQSLPINQRAFIRACRNADISQIESLILHDDVDPNIQGLTFCSPLHYVVCSYANPNHVEVVKLLLRHGVSPLSTAKNGASCVHALVANQTNDDVALQLLDALIYDTTSANQLNIPDRDSNTPLHLAAQLGRIPLVFALLRKADRYGKSCVDRRNIKGEVALHLTQSSTIARALLIHEPEHVNTQNSLGRTALHQAVSKKNLELVLVLLDHKASPDVQDHHGFSPLSLVQQLSHKNETDHLLENNLQLARIRRKKEQEGQSVEMGDQPYYNPNRELGPPDRDEILQLIEESRSQYERSLELLRIEYDTKIGQLQQMVTDLRTPTSPPMTIINRTTGRNTSTSSAT